METVTVDEIFRLMRSGGGRFFSVEFERRTRSRHSAQVEGDRRVMLCRTQMQAHKKGIISDVLRDEEDFRCAVLTVWSVNDFMRLRKLGQNHRDAGFNSWRRIDLAGIVKCSILTPNEVDIWIRLEIHRITNPYRLQNLPQLINRR